MILTKVTYDSNVRYELTYICHNCEKEIPDNRFEYCPYCGVKLIKDGRPENLELDESDICGLIALAITNGGFEKSGREFMQHGKTIEYEFPENHGGMMWASWSRKRQNQMQKEREKQKGGAE